MPSRDDIARAALHFIIAQAGRSERGQDQLPALKRAIVRELVGRGFDRAAADVRFDELVERYQAGWQPQKKPYLDHGDDG